jgi:toxin YoeB
MVNALESSFPPRSSPQSRDTFIFSPLPPTPNGSAEDWWITKPPGFSPAIYATDVAARRVGGLYPLAEEGPQAFTQVNDLIRDTLRNPFTGIGKPEPLKGNLKGWWSRRIDTEHPLVYRVEPDVLIIMQCRFRYSS